MKIEHIAIWTRDIEILRAFYEKYFAADSGRRYVNAKKGFSSYFLKFRCGARLELMQLNSVVASGEPARRNYYGFAHIAFSVGSKELVDQLTEKFKRDKYEILDGPRTTGDGYYESVVLDPEGNRLEITV
jgi:lactoylglutathione lyase